MRTPSPLLITFAAFALTSTAALADSFHEKCPDIPTCAKVVSELLGQKYVFDDGVKGKLEATANLEFTKENAVWLFTDMLFTNGFTRVALGHDTYQIMRMRDAKDSIVPLIEASKQVLPSLGDNWDVATMRYKATNPEVVEHISREIRNFMPPNSRILPSELDGTLLITDSGPNLKKIYEIIKNLDQKPSAALLKKWADAEKEHRADRAMRGHDEPRPPAGPDKK